VVLGLCLGFMHGSCSRTDGADTQYDIGDERLARGLVDLFEQRRLEKGELLKPDGIFNQQMEPLESDSVRACMLRDRLSGDFRPALTQAGLE